jgi:lipoate-protein ligase A
VLCFLDQTPGDLLAAGAKIVGSAQRKHRGALLQHGGILLKQSEFTPTLPGLRESSGIEVAPHDLAQAIAAEFAADTGWTLEPGSWTADELAARERIEAERYAHPAWNEKR